MIGFIQGKVLDTDGKKAIILTESGIGYDVNYGYFLEKNTSIGLFIHHHVSENDQSLWGFNCLEDKKMFELLKTVNKVGSSKAYPLVAIIGTKSLMEAIMFEQTNVLTAAPGIGKKMAEQIILSLKDKIEKFRSTQLNPESVELDIEQHHLPDRNAAIDPHLMNDVLMALDSLGYKDKDVTNLVKKQLELGTQSGSDIIKNILREL
jgi:Holliday junction DNA helicase RuvA